jgi:hypothetical protein
MSVGLVVSDVLSRISWTAFSARRAAGYYERLGLAVFDALPSISVDGVWQK